jgi:hypothetical protein
MIQAIVPELSHNPQHLPALHVYGGSGAGATMVPKGQHNVKGQAGLGCKRNSLLLGGHLEFSQELLISGL